MKARNEQKDCHLSLWLVFWNKWTRSIEAMLVVRQSQWCHVATNMETKYPASRAITVVVYTIDYSFVYFIKNDAYILGIIILFERMKSGQ